MGGAAVRKSCPSGRSNGRRFRHCVGMFRSVLTRRRRRTWSPALALAIGAGILAGCASPQANKTTTTTTTTSSTEAPPTSARTTTSSTPPPTTTPVSSKQAVAAAWEAEVNAFYMAGELGEPAYAPLLRSWVRGGPVALHAAGFLQAQAAAGVIGPSTWRIGNIRVVALSGQVAQVKGCSYDPGSHYKSSGAVAPTDLGGGAGFTAYETTLDLIANRWLVDSSVTSSPSSSTVPGPCQGF